MESVYSWTHETELEGKCRSDADFTSVEHRLGRIIDPKITSVQDFHILDKTTSLLGSRNPFAKSVTTDNIVWVMDNTAFRPHTAQKLGPWQAEFVGCYFYKGRKTITAAVTDLADLMGLDGAAGHDEATRKRIEERLAPFVYAIAPARTIQVTIASPDPSGLPLNLTLGPSNPNGISSQVFETGGSDAANGSTAAVTSKMIPEVTGHTRFASPEGWAVISDIDDTIKITKTVNPIGILQTTFADVPQTTQGLPEFYKRIQNQLNPTWFYLSASPYNLYPFLRKFIDDNYAPGTIILRDSSWMYFGGLLQSFTQGVQAYKVDRMRKIHSWLPLRKYVCVGDSTQSDPEAYAQIYKEFPGWIKAIFIRKVVGIPYMEVKNKPERFEKAFEGVPANVWQVFEDPATLDEHLKRLGQ